MDSEITSESRSKRIERTAADWLAKRDGDSWSEADADAFRRWQEESTAHRVAVIRLRHIWQQADRLQALGAGVPPETVPAPDQWRLSAFFNPRSEPVADRFLAGVQRDEEPARQSRRAGWRFGAVAASTLVAGILGVTWYLWSSGGPTYATAVGGFATVPMNDGSKVTLNTNSKVRITLTQTERRVELRQGEAFFEVAKDPQRPFVVQAGDKRVVAVGTQFSVRRDGADIRVVVTEGKVRVETPMLLHSAREQRVGAGQESSADATVLTAGTVAQAGEAGVLVQQSSVTAAEKTLSWRSGYLAFHDTTLEEAVGELNRYNERELVIADPALASLRIGGNLRATNVDAFVRLLKKSFPISVHEEGDRIVLEKR